MLSRVGTGPPVAGFLLMCFDRQREPSFRPNFQTQLDGLSNALQSFFPCHALAGAPKDSRRLSNPYLISIAIESCSKLNDVPQQSLSMSLVTCSNAYSLSYRIIHGTSRSLTRYILRAFKRRLWRSGAMEPIDPAMIRRGKTARNPNRMSEAATRPLDVKSASSGVMISSNP